MNSNNDEFPVSLDRTYEQIEHKDKEVENSLVERVKQDITNSIQDVCEDYINVVLKDFLKSGLAEQYGIKIVRDGNDPTIIHICLAKELSFVPIDVLEGEED